MECEGVRAETLKLTSDRVGLGYLRWYWKWLWTVGLKAEDGERRALLYILLLLPQRRHVSRASLVRAVEGQLNYRRLQMDPYLVPVVFEALMEVGKSLGPSNRGRKNSLRMVHRKLQRFIETYFLL
jgi:hypothetical protein